MKPHIRGQSAVGGPAYRGHWWVARCSTWLPESIRILDNDLAVWVWVAGGLFLLPCPRTVPALLPPPGQASTDRWGNDLGRRATQPDWRRRGRRRLRGRHPAVGLSPGSWQPRTTRSPKELGDSGIWCTAGGPPARTDLQPALGNNLPSPSAGSSPAALAGLIAVALAIPFAAGNFS